MIQGAAVAAESGGRRPAVRAGSDRWRLLGELLQLRREALGYRYRPAFTADRGINIRMVSDIENVHRPNTFSLPALQQIARAYAVTYDSVTAVLRGDAEDRKSTRLHSSHTCISHAVFC